MLLVLLLLQAQMDLESLQMVWVRAVVLLLLQALLVQKKLHNTMVPSCVLGAMGGSVLQTQSCVSNGILHTIILFFHYVVKYVESEFLQASKFTLKSSISYWLEISNYHSTLCYHAMPKQQWL